MKNNLPFRTCWELGEKEKLLIGMALLLLAILTPRAMVAQALRVTIDVKDAPLHQVFQAINKQTKISVVYNVDDIDPNRKVTLYARNETVARTLDLLFHETNIVYTLIDKHIVLSVRRSSSTERHKTTVTQTRTIRGKVIDDQNVPLMGVNVFIKDTGKGVITDEAGNYVLELPVDKEMVSFSYIGYLPQELSAAGKQYLNAVLKENPTLLNEVVITALGLEKETRSLTYSLQTLPGTELTRSKEVNFANSLQGKSAGLVVVPNSNGAGASTKLLLRGNKSIQGNNNPLIVIDGIPMANNNYGGGIEVLYGRGNDGGDALSTVNPDDIATITVLKGAGASALYGAEAANGVIMVTTKRGNVGAIRVRLSSNTTVEAAYSLPKLQQSYGAKQLNPGTLQAQSWGDRITGEVSDNLRAFFRKGYTLHNSISINGGTEHAQSYFSYGNVTSAGIVPTNRFMRHNFAIRQSFQGFENRLSLNLSGTYAYQSTVNKHYGGMLGNPLTGLYLFPPNADFGAYQKEFERYDPRREINVQHWLQTEEHNQNPYWLLHRNRKQEERHRTTFNATAKYKLTPALNIQGRVGFENDDIDFRVERFATSWKDEMGGYKEIGSSYKHLYADVLMNLETRWRGFSIEATLGASVSSVREAEAGIVTDGGNTRFEWLEVEDATTGKVYKVPNGGNAYFVNNFTQNNYYRPQLVEEQSHTRLNSLFGTVQIGYKALAYVSITARNDWSSTLAFTDNKHMGYFYPSFGANLLLSELVPAIKQRIGLLKLRASYSVVGNGLPAYVSAQRPVIDGTSIAYPASAPFADLKPERTLSLEGGVELALMNNRLSMDLSVYQTNTLNQYFTVEAPWGSGYRYRNVNAGDVQNRGVELSLNLFLSPTPTLNWHTTASVAYNKNRINELYKEIDSFVLQDAGGVICLLKQGGAYGDIYTRSLLRGDDGALLLDTNGAPIKAEQPDTYVGNLNANIHLGWSHSISYANVGLYALIDGRIGGKVVAATEAVLDGYGVSERSAKARQAGGVPRGDGTRIDAAKYYHSVGATAYNAGFVGTEYVYNATNFRLRELALSYQFDNLLAPGKHLTLALIARNLCFLYKEAPTDPDVSGSTGNGWQGIDVFNLPLQRSIGINLKLTL